MTIPESELAEMLERESTDFMWLACCPNRHCRWNNAYNIESEAPALCPECATEVDIIAPCAALGDESHE
jgi:hypothetical protein